MTWSRYLLGIIGLGFGGQMFFTSGSPGVAILGVALSGVSLVVLDVKSPLHIDTEGTDDE
jgi:hypothetical protein